jgi:RNA polymerase sigma-70 factor (sigma-E family)
VDDFDTYATARLPQLRRSAYLLCGDWDRGDDLVQRVLTDLFVHWSKVKHANNLDAYTQKMLVNRFLDDRRSGWFRRVLLAGADRHEESAAGHVDDPALRLDLHAALAYLPPRQRAVVVLRFLHDQSVEQTAASLGCTSGTVKSQTSHALSTLRNVLNRDTTPLWSQG